MAEGAPATEFWQSRNTIKVSSLAGRPGSVSLLLCVSVSLSSLPHRVIYKCLRRTEVINAVPVWDAEEGPSSSASHHGPGALTLL